MPFYAGSARVANIRVEQLPELGVSDYGFLPMNGADVVRSVALKNDTDAGTWATIKLLATGVGTFAGGPAVGGLALLGASAFEDVYTAYHENKKGGEQFWSDYLKNLEEVARPDSGLVDMAEGFNAVTSYIAKGAGNALPLSKGWGYHVGDITGMLLRDTAAFMIGGASGGLTLPANMAISDFFNKGAEKYAMTDDLSAAMRPAIAAGVSAGATGALFLYGLPKVLGETSYKLINGVANTPFEKAATIAANSAMGGAEFAGWTGTQAVTEDWINGDFSLPSVDAVSILASAGMGIVVRGAVRSHGVFKGKGDAPVVKDPETGKEDTAAWFEDRAIEQERLAAAQAAEKQAVDMGMPAGVPEERMAGEGAWLPGNEELPWRIAQARQGYEDFKKGVSSYTAVGDGATMPFSNMQAAKMADSIGKQYHQLTAQGVDVNLGDLVTTRMARLSGFSDEYRNGTIGGGGGRYYSAENIEKVNSFLYRQMPNSQEIKSLDSYYADMRKRVFPDEPVATVNEGGVEMRKQSVAERYDEIEKALTMDEQDIYNEQLSSLADRGIEGYQAKRIAIGAVNEWRGGSLIRDMEKNKVEQAAAQVEAAKRAEAESIYQSNQHFDMEFIDADAIRKVMNDARTQLGLDTILFGAKTGDAAYRLKEYERIAPLLMRKEVYSRGGTYIEAAIGMDRIVDKIKSMKGDEQWKETTTTILDDLVAGKIDYNKYGEKYKKATEEYLKTIATGRRQIGSTVESIMSYAHGMTDMPRRELLTMLREAEKKYGGIIPSNVGAVYKDAIAEAGNLRNGKFDYKAFRDIMDSPDTQKKLAEEHIVYTDLANQTELDVFGQPVKVKATRARIKKAKEAKSAGSK